MSCLAIFLASKLPEILSGSERIDSRSEVKKVNFTALTIFSMISRGTRQRVVHISLGEESICHKVF